MRRELKYLLVILQLLIIFSCKNNDEISADSNEIFIVESEFIGPSSESFISIIKQDGNILFDTIGQDLRKTIKMQILDTDKIDVTYGYENNQGFKIVTYKNIESNFLVSRSNYECNNEPPFGIGGKRFTLEIQGITEYRELYYPFDFKDMPEVDQGGNKIILNGGILNTKDIVVTILGEDYEYKSIYLKYEDWIDQGDNNFFKSLNIEEFLTPQEYEINLGIDDKWMVNAEIQTNEERLVSISKWVTYDDYQNGDKVKLFLTSEIEMDLMKLEIGNSSILKGYHYLRTIEDIPSQISLYNPEIELLTISSTGYEVNVNEDYNLAKIEYQYIENNWISSWEIFQKSSESLLNELPTIPSEYLSQSILLSNQLSNPERVIVNIYKISDEMLEDRYNMTGIDRQIKCIDYVSRFTGEEF